jgi:hypothetical protein
MCAPAAPSPGKLKVREENSLTGMFNAGLRVDWYTQRVG